MILQEALYAGTIYLATKEEETPLTFSAKEEGVKDYIEMSKGSLGTINYQGVRNNRGRENRALPYGTPREGKEKNTVLGTIEETQRAWT